MSRAIILLQFFRKTLAFVPGGFTGQISLIDTEHAERLSRLAALLGLPDAINRIPVHRLEVDAPCLQRCFQTPNSGIGMQPRVIADHITLAERGRDEITDGIAAIFREGENLAIGLVAHL